MKNYPVAKPNVKALCDAATYESMYAESINDSDAFWAKQAKEFLHWTKEWDQVSDVDYNKGKI
ncbi:MAG: acetyl-coenzyme A synthetase N-terminal domain-containing protein, partial [Candidatus Thioglobus sp.]